MKKIFIVSVLALTLGVTACGNTSDTAEATAVQTTVAQTTIEQPTVAESTSAQETPAQTTTIQETKKMTELAETVNVKTPGEAATVTSETPTEADPTEGATEALTEATTTEIAMEASAEATTEATIEAPPETTTAQEVPTTTESATQETTDFRTIVVEDGVTIDKTPRSLGGPDMNGNTWYEKNTWTASNGYQVKITDQSALVLTDPDASHSRNDIYIDGTEDIAPNSAWSVAVIEYVYSDEMKTAGGTDRYNPEIVDVSKLPYVSTVSSKQTSLTATAEWNAYKEVFDPMHNFQSCGIWEFSPFHMLHLTDDFIGLAADGIGYLWEIKYTSAEEYDSSIHPVDCWRVTFINNPSELSWHGFHTALKMITPDADAVYEAVYQSFYYDHELSDNPGTWFTYGNTELCGKADGYVFYYFK